MSNIAYNLHLTLISESSKDSPISWKIYTIGATGVVFEASLKENINYNLEDTKNF